MSVEEYAPESFEIIEEDFIDEETTEEPVYAVPVDIKQENNLQSNEIQIFQKKYQNVDETYTDRDKDRKTNVYYRVVGNQTFVSNEQFCEENIQNPDVLAQCEEHENLIPHSEEITLIHSDNIKSEATDFVCQTCNSFFNSMDDAECHQCTNSNTPNNIIVCGSCQVVLGSEDDMEEHVCSSNIKEENIRSVFSCPNCSKTFSSISLLQSHQNTHKPKMVTPKVNKETTKNDSSKVDLTHCYICNTTFSSKKNLKLHSKMHVKTQTKTIKDAMPVGTEELSDANKFYCEICNKSFDQTLLYIHQNMHQNIEEHNCSICNRQFENQVSYDMHVQLHADQPAKVRPQQCPKPGAKFPCNYCGKDFLRPHEKVKHERIHTGEKPYECEVCGKSFRVSYSLTLHLRTHTDIRPFVCAQCNKRFKSYAVYSHHLNTHSEDRPYKCLMCTKSFRTSVQLCGHKNSHTKPYNCPECNRPFSSLYAVKMHMKTHNKANKSNENLKHRCVTCGAVYARMFALRLHMKEQHSIYLDEDQKKDVNNTDIETPVIANDCLHEDEVSTQAILQGEEIIIDNFQPEEIVTDWLTQK